MAFVSHFFSVCRFYAWKPFLMACLLLGSLVSACAAPSKPVDQLQEFRKALEEHETSFDILAENWDEDICSWQGALDVLSDILNETPEYYFIDVKHTRITPWLAGDDVVRYEIQPVYFLDLESPEAQDELEICTQNLLDQLDEEADDWNKALQLHDLLIDHITYTEGPYDQNLYGALVQGKAVCNGYAMAYEYLCQKAGIDCDTIVGYTPPRTHSGQDGETQEAVTIISVEDNTSHAAETSKEGLDAHAWNYITLENAEGEKASTFVDLTWDDLDLYDENQQAYICYDWFGLSGEQLEEAGRQLMPEMYHFDRLESDDHLNYYAKSGNVLLEWNPKTATCLLKNQKEAGQSLLALAFASRQAWEDFALLDQETMENEIFDLMEGIDGGDEGAYDFASPKQTGSALYTFHLYLNYPSPSKS